MDAFADRLRHSDEQVEIGDTPLASDHGELRLRVYTPRTIRGGLVWIHGGAFSLGAPEMDDDLCRSIALEHDLLVVSPDYRLAPEHAYPAAEHDCRAAAQWLVSRLAAEDPAAARLLLGGASAGGALALRTALSVVENGGALDRLLLVYPVVEPSRTQAMETYTSAPIFDAEQAVLMWDRYLPGGVASWRSLLGAESLHLLPFTFVVTAEHDPLRDHGLDLVRELLSAGVSVQALHVAGAFHAYDRFAPESTLAQQFRQAVDDFLRRTPPIAADW